MALCPTRVAIEAEVEPSGQSTLKFKVLSGPPRPLRSLSIPLDAPPMAPFIAMPPSAVIPDSIELAGKALWSGLTQDPNFQPSFAHVQATAWPDRGIVVHIPAYAATAHNYPWEILHDGAAFAAPAGVAFVRTVEPRAGAQRANRVLDGNLRHLSIIAAAGVSGLDEWNALAASFAGYNHPLDRLVLVSDPDLKTHIEGQPKPPVVEMVPVSEPDLLARIDSYAPHLCHIFCHGSPLGLQIANNNTEYGARPLNITGQLLASSLRSAWLVCLIACATGAVGETSGTSTVGSELVEAGVPFVTCMRENVPTDAASIFTRTFLAAVFTDLSAKAGGQNFPLNFDDAMTRARAGLALWKGDPLFNLSKEWTLPILCTMGQPAGPAQFSVTRTASPVTAFDLVATIRQISDLQAALASGNFEPQRGAIEAKIAELTQQMAPPPQPLQGTANG